MGLSFLGHTPSFEIWVFNVNGRELVARNFSTPSPLQLSFIGNWDKYSGGEPLIKTSGFNISESTNTNAIWQWAGNQYASWWMAISTDDDDPEAQVTLKFGPPVQYSGPPVAPVGPVVAKSNDGQKQAEISQGLISEFKDSIDSANRALAVSEAQRKVDINALNSARIEIEEAKRKLAEAQSKATRDQEVLLAQMSEKVQEMQERAEIQINIARQMIAAQQAPPPAPVSTGTIPSPVVRTPAAPVAPASTSQTDWVKLGLQLGAAYLLLA
jgi:hypothetical protein